ncbi:MAG: hypothetical protein JWN46_3214 [Acidimicrobiales bacterium]|nr:hypothetical protein [Acidimicrobiales bacterium]
MSVRSKAFGRCGAVIIVGASSVATLVWAAPASASVTTTSSGTVVTVDVLGDDTIGFDCLSGAFSVNGSPASPSVACNAVTSVIVTGDGGAQDVRAHQLDTRFSALESVSMTLAGGADTAYESRVSDTIDMGPGNDTVLLLPQSGPLNSNVDLGAGSDFVIVQGSAAAEQLTVSAVSPTLGVIDMFPGGTGTRYASNAERLNVEGGAGNDTLDTTGVTAASGITEITLDGGPGDDTLTGGDTRTTLVGGSGRNTFNGGTAPDTLLTSSRGDVIHTGVGPDTVISYSPPFGGRTIDGGASDNDQLIEVPTNGDNIIRVRERPSNRSLFTVSLAGGGQQPVPSNFATVVFNNGGLLTPVDRNIVDTVPLAHQEQQFNADGDALLDLTVPPGEVPTLTGTAAAGIISFTSHQRILTVGFANRLVHGPWTDPNESFAHRVVRDLYLRFATDAERFRIRDDLAAHRATSASVAASLIDTDGYRGLDVDRAFTQYLDRTSDPSGRAYWIGRIRSGLHLRLLRASLLGSDEYFHRLGSDDVTYMHGIYAVVLGRQPDAAGLAYWVGRIQGGLPRGSVADRFLDATESRRAIVTDQFLRFLDRAPTDAESSRWVDQLQATTGEQQLVGALAGSASYFART